MRQRPLSRLGGGDRRGDRRVGGGAEPPPTTPAVAAGAPQQRDAGDTESEPAAASKSLLMQVRSWRQATRAGDTQVRAAALLKYPRLGGSSESTKSEG